MVRRSLRLPSLHHPADHVSYTNAPKYVCPRDQVRTCSLPCYKKHQQRASCDGKRDPTAYVKKEQLATASGIDHDYNFLSGVERVFGSADKNLEERGIGGVPDSVQKRWQFNGPLQRYLREHRVVVDRAPSGMSRQKTNQTRYIQKSKKIVWTVEWVDADGSKKTSEVHEAATIGDAYAAMLAEKERESRKRKRSVSLDGSPRVTKPEADIKRRPVQEAHNNLAEQPSTATMDMEADTSIEPGDTSNANPDLGQPDRENAHPKEVPDVDERPVAEIVTAEPADGIGHNTNEVDEDCRDPKTPSHPPYFYLLKPHTSSISRVLIPLVPDDTLTKSLEDQTVLEFPTLFVLDQSSDALPSGFESEERYLKTQQEEAKEVEELLRVVPGASKGALYGESTGAGNAGGGHTADLDPSKILEMLKRDVR